MIHALLLALATSPAPCDRGVKITHVAVATYPEASRELNLGPLHIVVAVDVAADGSATRAEIEKSSGNSYLDRSALRAARASTYAPARAGCKAVAGRYILHVDFPAANYKNTTPDFIDTITTTATPTPGPCNREAAATNAVVPDFPQALVGKLAGSVVVLVTVTIDATGKVVSTQVARSSGIPTLDAAAVEAATKSTYSPKVVDCKTVDGSYSFAAQFNP